MSPAQPAPTPAATATSTQTYLHTGEVAELFRVSPKTVTAWAKAGKLPHIRTLGGHARFPEAEIRRRAAVVGGQPTTPPGGAPR